MNTLTFLRENARWLGAGFLLALTSSYGQTFFISIFAAEIMAAAALTDGQWGLLYTLATTASALAMVWAGTLTDRFRVRRLAPFVLGGLALSCLAMAALPGSGRGVVWILVPVIFALRFFGQGMTSQLTIVSMARWFAANRGRALSIAALGFATGQAVLPVLFVALLVIMPWRLLWVVAAVLTVMMVPVIHWLLTQERQPRSEAGDDAVAGMKGRHWTRGDALRNPLIWLMVPMLLGPSAWITSLFFQQVHLAQVKGWSHPGFVALFPLFTLSSVTTSLIAGWAIDRFGATRMISGYMLPFALGFGMLWYADSLSQAALAMVALGLANGISSTLPSAFWAEVYGTRYLGSIKALIAAVMVFGSAIGPGVSGLLIDHGIDFPHQMPVIALYFLAAAGMATLGVATIRRSA
ncbi:MFS transporter [Frigidibacter sp. ROC022]|uniref:MFS transporter n=1 Tax=Frigidibacter sp. ROC022 TaxID=2971796 RepID=UPI00215B3310|nr:MFS transporter [Frigidibacter sp. ROC022]MCR8725980.1 MFS transporter [Frigidibacter sp. ROC022]